MTDIEPPRLGPHASDPYRSTPPAPAPDPLIVPYAGQARMALTVTGGLANARLRVDPDARVLVRIDPDLGPPPHVHVTDEEVRVAFPLSVRWWRLLFAGEVAAPVLDLHPAVAWTIAIRGGVANLRADLTRGALAGFEVSGGASQVELDLPRPTRAVPIQIRGGASGLRLRRPADVGVAIAVSGGVTSLQLDANHFDAIGGGARLSTGAVGAAPHVAIAVSGGTSDLEVAPATGAKADRDGAGRW